MLILELIYWKMIDLYRFFKYPRKIHLYGVWLFCGLYGQGKTIALTEYLTRMRKKYGDKIYIATNYGFLGEDFPLVHWKDLLIERDKSIIFGYDEIQNDFNSRDYQNFPFELITLLTQNRKGSGKQIVGTAQKFSHVDKTIRDLCSHVIEVRTVFGRLTSTRRYHIEDYEQLINTANVDKKIKIRPHRYRFVQPDTLRGAYDSYHMLESAKSKEYINQNERTAKRCAINVSVE